MGTFSRDLRGEQCRRIGRTEIHGEVIRDVDLTTPNKMWQHPWQLVHRVALHNKLKETATSKSEPGIPAVIRNANKAVSV